MQSNLTYEKILAFWYQNKDRSSTNFSFSYKKIAMHSKNFEVFELLSKKIQNEITIFSKVTPLT